MKNLVPILLMMLVGMAIGYGIRPFIDSTSSVDGGGTFANPDPLPEGTVSYLNLHDEATSVSSRKISESVLSISRSCTILRNKMESVCSKNPESKECTDLQKEYQNKDCNRLIETGDNIADALGSAGPDDCFACLPSIFDDLESISFPPEYRIGFKLKMLRGIDKTKPDFDLYEIPDKKGIVALDWKSFKGPARLEVINKNEEVVSQVRLLIE